MGGGEGERVGGGKAGGPVLTVGESVVGTVAVGILVRIIIPVVDFAFLIAVVADAVLLPAIVVIVVERGVVEDLERVVRAVSVCFETFARGVGVDMRWLVDYGRKGAAARGEVGDVGAQASETWHSLEDIDSEDHEMQIIG